MTPYEVALLIAGLVLSVIAFAMVFVRWLRVAQREHYIAGWVWRIWWLWLVRLPVNAGLLVVAVAAAIVGVFVIPVALAALVIAGVLPLGLGLRGRSAKLAWTDRTKRLAAAYAVVLLGLGTLALLTLGFGAVAIVVLAAPLLMDLVLIPMNLLEKKLSHKYLVSARKRLGQVKPTVVAITGSYGKTSTKGYVAHMLSGAYTVVASPASFNNLMGLSRAVNDRVVPGTEVFVAEMGVYGPGEIRELSESFPPDIAAITTIGEAHLARMKTRETIAAAKAEITERAATVVLPIDQPELAQLADKCLADGKRVISVSTVPGTPADAVVDPENATVTIGDSVHPVALSGTGHAVNVAVTVGIALAMGMEASAIAPRLANLPGSQHRAEVQEAPGGTVIVDDTYNSNPVGAGRALEGAVELAAERGGALVVVTPGMVELGPVQRERNSQFGAAVAAAGGHLLIVGRTNRSALTQGASTGVNPPQTFVRREHAVQRALDLAGDRGVILYENDLPDHYP